MASRTWYSKSLMSDSILRSNSRTFCRCLLAFIFQALHLAREILFALLRCMALTFKIAQLRVQTVEKLTDILVCVVSVHARRQ